MDLDASLATIFEILADERLLFILENRYPIPKLEVRPILTEKKKNSVMCVLTLPLYITILLLPQLRLQHLPLPRLPPEQERLPHVEDKNLGRRALFRNDDTKNDL